MEQPMDPNENNELSRSGDKRDFGSSSSKSSRSNRDRERDRDNRDRDRDSKDRDKDKSRSRSDKHSSSKSSRHRSRSRSPGRHPSSSHRSRRKHSKSRSPSPRKERKRSSMWDQPPGMAGAAMTGMPMIPGVLPPGSHQSRQATRLYVGNIPAGVTEQEIADFFNTAMLTANSSGQDGSPIVSVQINVEKSYAFLEFRSVEETSAGMAFDGIMLQGHALKVRRPKDYQPLPGDSGNNMLALPNIVSTNVSDSPHKIFIGGLPSNLNEEQVKELLGSFGALRSFNLVKDLQTGFSKGYAFFEYQDESVTDVACKGLNGMKLGDKTLLVQRAQIGAKNQNASAAAAMLAQTNPIALNFLNLSVPIAVVLSNLTVTSPITSSTVVMLLNMISPEDVAAEEDYQDVYDDVMDECSRHGKVKTIFIPRPDAERRSEPTIGKVFVEFETLDAAIKAHDALGGRKYGGRTAITTFFDADKFHAQDFT